MSRDYEGKTSLQFNSSDADFAIKSSDNMIFHLHRANIEVQAGAFPSSNLQRLPESAHVLVLLFPFLYPQNHPKLADLDFKTVEAVATAAQKYKIFSVMHISQVRLRGFLPKHAKEILNYAAKFNYPDLVDETAPLCVRYSVHDTLMGLPSHAWLPWALYHKAWETIFEAIIKSLQSNPNGAPFSNNHEHCDLPYTFCKNCQIYLIAWVDKIRKVESIDGLETILSFDMAAKVSIPASPCLCYECGGRYCRQLPKIKQMCEVGIKTMRGFPFSLFLESDSPQNDIFIQATNAVVASVANGSYSGCTIH